MCRRPRLSVAVACRSADLHAPRVLRRATATKNFRNENVALYYIGGDGLLWNFFPRARATASLSVSYDPVTREVSKIMASAFTTWVTPLANRVGPFLCTVKMIQYGRVTTIGSPPTLTGLTGYDMWLPGGTKAWWNGQKTWRYFTPVGNTLEVELSCLLQLAVDFKNTYTPAGDKGVLKVRGKVFWP